MAEHRGSMTTIAEATEALTGPGGQFEVVTTDEIDGKPMKVYKTGFPTCAS
ncbi:MAG: hypothetical protein R2716_07675 [Microthrixaceae bacterium]